MKKNGKNNKLSNEKQKQYETQAMSQWGEDRVKQSTQLWNSYEEKKKEQIMEELLDLAEFQAIYKLL